MFDKLNGIELWDPDDLFHTHHCFLSSCLYFSCEATQRISCLWPLSSPHYPLSSCQNCLPKAQTSYLTWPRSKTSPGFSLQEMASNLFNKAHRSFNPPLYLTSLRAPKLYATLNFFCCWNEFGPLKPPGPCMHRRSLCSNVLLSYTWKIFTHSIWSIGTKSPPSSSLSWILAGRVSCLLPVPTAHCSYWYYNTRDLWTSEVWTVWVHLHTDFSR